MTGDELKRELQRAGLGHIEAAAGFGVNPVQLRAWISGKLLVPDEISAKVKALPDRPQRNP